MGTGGAAQARLMRASNIVVFLADDHSLLDSSVYRSTDVRTPSAGWRKRA